jgi:hypothetical protein
MASKVDSGPLRSGCLRDSGVWPESLSDANIFESKWCSLRNQSHSHEESESIIREYSQHIETDHAIRAIPALSSR